MQVCPKWTETLVTVMMKHPVQVYITIGHFKNTEALIFGAALGFSYYLVYLVPIGTILSKIYQ